MDQAQVSLVELSAQVQFGLRLMDGWIEPLNIPLRPQISPLRHQISLLILRRLIQPIQFQVSPPKLPSQASNQPR